MNCNKRHKKNIARFTILGIFENLQYFGNIGFQHFLWSVTCALFFLLYLLGKINDTLPILIFFEKSIKIRVTFNHDLFRLGALFSICSNRAGTGSISPRQAFSRHFLALFFPTWLLRGKFLPNLALEAKLAIFFNFFFKLANCNKRHKKNIARFTILKLSENLQYFGNIGF